MKKIVLIFIVVVLLIFPAYAANQISCHLDELDLTVGISSDYNVITRDTPYSSQIFSDLDVPASEMIDFLVENSIYLNAISEDFLEEIVITMAPSPTNDFSGLDKSDIYVLLSQFISIYENNGIEVFEYSVYENSDNKFFKVDFYNPNEYLYAVQYYTVYNGNGINFTFRKYFDEIGVADEKVIKDVVDSVEYHSEMPEPAVAEETEAFEFVDHDTNTTFTVPRNWKIAQLSEKREFIDTSFQSTKNKYMQIMYGSTDMWSILPEDERYGYERSDIDNSAFTVWDFAEFTNIDPNNISMVKYGDVEYFQIVVDDYSETVGKYGLEMEFEVDMTVLVHIRNGWWYSFYFGGTSQSQYEYFDDFVSLIESVKYPDVNISETSSLPQDDTKEEKQSVQEKKEITKSSSTIQKTTQIREADTVAIIVVIFIIAFVCVAVYILDKTGTVKADSQKLKASEENKSDTQTAEKTESADIYCHNCGHKLPHDSVFCHMCGTKIVKGDDRT